MILDDTSLRHRIGIENTKSNCWMSAVIQVICGTGLINVFLSYEGSSVLPLSKELESIRIKFTKKGKRPISLESVRNVGVVVDIQTFDPNTSGQQDASEFYSAIVLYYFDYITKFAVWTYATV